MPCALFCLCFIDNYYMLELKICAVNHMPFAFSLLYMTSDFVQSVSSFLLWPASLRGPRNRISLPLMCQLTFKMWMVYFFSGNKSVPLLLNNCGQNGM